MNKIKERYGSLSAEELKEFDSLILELQELNGGPVESRRQVKEIKSLPEPENTRLWEYMLHMIKLTLCLPNNMKIIRQIANVDDFNDISYYLDTLPIELAPFVYKYMWRKYKSSENCGYIISTTNFAFIDWLSKRNNVIAKRVASEAEFDGTLSNKVVTRNF